MVITQISAIPKSTLGKARKAPFRMKKLIGATVLMRCLSEGFCITEKNKLLNCLKLLNSKTALETYLHH